MHFFPWRYDFVQTTETGFGGTTIKETNLQMMSKFEIL
jgi:hypothetical protein